MNTFIRPSTRQPY